MRKDLVSSLLILATTIAFNSPRVAAQEPNRTHEFLPPGSTWESLERNSGGRIKVHNGMELIERRKKGLPTTLPGVLTREIPWDERRDKHCTSPVQFAEPVNVILTDFSPISGDPVAAGKYQVWMTLDDAEFDEVSIVLENGGKKIPLDALRTSAGGYTVRQITIPTDEFYIGFSARTRNGEQVYERCTGEINPTSRLFGGGIANAAANAMARNSRDENTSTAIRPPRAELQSFRVEPVVSASGLTVRFLFDYTVSIVGEFRGSLIPKVEQKLSSGRTLSYNWGNAEVTPPFERAIPGKTFTGFPRGDTVYHFRVEFSPPFFLPNREATRHCLIPKGRSTSSTPSLEEAVNETGDEVTFLIPDLFVSKQVKVPPAGTLVSNLLSESVGECGLTVQGMFDHNF